MPATRRLPTNEPSTTEVLATQKLRKQRRNPLPQQRGNGRSMGVNVQGGLTGAAPVIPGGKVPIANRVP